MKEAHFPTGEDDERSKQEGAVSTISDAPRTLETNKNHMMEEKAHGCHCLV